MPSLECWSVLSVNCDLWTISWVRGNWRQWPPSLPPPTENLLATDYGFLASTPPQSRRWLVGSLVYQDFPAECCHHSQFLHDGHDGCCVERENILFPRHCLMVRVPVKLAGKCHPFFSGREKLNFIKQYFSVLFRITLPPRVFFSAFCLC